MYTLMDLFAGAGGMTRGFVDTGRFDPVFAVEMDEHAAATYAANFGEELERIIKGALAAAPVAQQTR